MQTYKKPVVPAPPDSWMVRAVEFVYQNRRKTATGAAAVLALFLGYHVIFGANGLAVLDQKRQQAHHLEAQIKELQTENAQLKQHVDRLHDDPNAIEQIGRAHV